MSKSQFDEHPFPGFTLKQVLPDAGLIEFVNRSTPCGQHEEAEAFFRFQQAVDVQSGMNTEVVTINPDEEAPLPPSRHGKSEVRFAGTYPKFISLDKHRNLIALLPEGCVVRVEFVGDERARPHVKYFSTL